MMKLRDFKKKDAPIIASWIRSEEELYKWSADRFNKYPLSGDDINENYAPQLETGRFFPLTAVDDNEEVIGHFIIRYPRENDDSFVRFGFVILNPDLRGKGLGKEMLMSGIQYVKGHLSASRIDLGVFENNEKAMRCYESVGFKEYGRRDCVMPIGTWNCIDLELFIGRAVTDYSVRKVTIDDYDAIFDLWNSTEQSRRALNPVDDTREGIARYLKRNPNTCFAAVKDNKIIGVILTGHDGRRAIIHHMCVHPDYRRMGIAGHLVSLAEDALKKEGIQKIFGLVFKDNDVANAFWEREGYSLRTNLNYRNKSLNDDIPAGE